MADPNEDQTAEKNPPSPALVEAVIATARAQLGKPYKLGTEGPDQFDCSGLIWYVFNQNGAAALIGGGRHRARWYAKWFTEQGMFTTDAQRASRGDLVVFGHPDSITHIGLYLGAPRHRCISALIMPYGVSRTRIGGITVPVAGFCKVDY